MRFAPTGHDRAWVRVQLEIEVDTNHPLYYQERMRGYSQSTHVQSALERHFINNYLRNKGEDPLTSPGSRLDIHSIAHAKRTRVLGTYASAPAPVSVAVVTPEPESTGSSDPVSEETGATADGAAPEPPSWAFTVS